MNSSTFVKAAFLFALILQLTACERGAEAPQPVSETPMPSEVTPVTPTMNMEQHDQRLLAFFDETFERNVSQSPEFQAQLGRKTEDYGRWDDHSDAWAVTRREQAEADLARLRAEFDYDALSPSAQLSYRIFEYDQQQALRNFPWRHHDYAVTQMNNIASDIPTFLQNLHKVETRADAEAYIARLAGVETVMAQYIELLRLGESQGVIPPMLVYPRVLPAAGNMLQGAPFEEAAEDGVLLADFRGKLAALELDNAERDILLNDAANALSGPFRTGYAALIAELTRLQGLADDNNGIWDLPEGADFYANRIQNWTTIARPAEEIHERGR
jgi:uncharacterized protein (DUF885 family)